MSRGGDVQKDSVRIYRWRVICNNLYRQRRCRRTAKEVTRNTMLDLFCVRPSRHNTAGMPEKQAFIGEKQSICFIKTESTLSVVGIISTPSTEMSSFIQCNNDFFTVKTSLEIQSISSTCWPRLSHYGI